MMVSIVTGGLVRALAPTGASPAIIAASLSFCVGIWSLVFGFLNFGFIYDFLSLPVVLGFVSGLGQVLVIAQIPPILGLVGITPVFTQQIPDIIAKISQSKPPTIGIAATSILILGILQFFGNKWGRRSEIVRILAIQRNLLVLGIFTAISLSINSSRTQPLWSVLGPVSTVIPTPTMPSIALIKLLILPSLVLWATVNIEHVGMAKCYGHMNIYKINRSQEMVYLGFINLANSFFGGIPVGGGDLARTAINSASGAMSPLGGVFTSLMVFFCMYVASPFMRWLPQATAASVIIVAAVDKMPPISYMGKYWKLSFTDFVAFFVGFNVTMITTAEIGIGIGVGIMGFYTLLRLMFSRPLASDIEQSTPKSIRTKDPVPEGTQVVTLETDLTFLNAERIKRHVLHTAYTTKSGVEAASRAWNDRCDKRLKGENFPRLDTLVLDFTRAPFIDATGMQALEDIKKELGAYGGSEFSVRFVGMGKGARKRFERAGWGLISPYDGVLSETQDFVFDSLHEAIQYRRMGDITAFRFALSFPI
jgi:sodium-independent sulfate anion transporter 11